MWRLYPFDLFHQAPSTRLIATMILFILLLLHTSEATSTLLNPNSVARPSVTFGRDHSPLEKDIAAIFNKVAHGSTAAPINTSTHVPTTTSPIPTTAPVQSTTMSNLAYTPHTSIPDAPEFVSRIRFKPPLPPEYTNPFADKAILRGSQSEGPAAGGSRRQLPPPPIRPPPDTERIPIRPPDLAPPIINHDHRAKKPLNTPANGQRFENDVINKNETSQSDSEINSPTLLQIPSVTRILSEHVNSRPEDISDRNRNNSSNSRDLLDHVNKDSMIDIQAPTSPSLSSNNNNNNNNKDQSQDKNPKIVTDPPRSYPIAPEWPTHIGGMTWDVIVYTLASLFVLLALYAFFISPFRASDSLITKGSYIFLHFFLFIIGVCRGGYLFLDAYNIRGTLPRLLDRILLDMIYPCIFAAFSILFYALAKITKVQLCNSRAQNPTVLAFVIIINFIVFTGFEYAADTLDLIKFLVSALRALPLLSVISIIMGFLIGFRCIYRAARRLQGDVLRANFAKMGALPRRPQLKLASRIIFSASLLILILCGIQLYTLFGYYNVNEEPPRIWPWWSCQLILRILELCICFLLVSVGWLRRTGVPAKFQPCCCVVSTSDNKSVEDMFPAICSKNNAIHNYSLHTGKTVYENNTARKTTTTTTTTTTTAVPTAATNYIPPESVNTMPHHNMSLKRSSMNKCGTMPASNRSSSGDSSSKSNRYYNKHQNQHQKSSSMLFAEDGVVRFRTTNDPEQQMQEVLHRSLTRHEALTAFNVSDESQIGGRNKSGSLGDIRNGIEHDLYYYRSARRSTKTKANKSQPSHHHARSLDPPSPVENESSLSGGCSSSSESDLTSGGTGYERVRTSQNIRKNHRNLRYKTTS